MGFEPTACWFHSRVKSFGNNSAALTRLSYEPVTRAKRGLFLKVCERRVFKRTLKNKLMLDRKQIQLETVPWSNYQDLRRCLGKHNRHDREDKKTTYAEIKEPLKLSNFEELIYQAEADNPVRRLSVPATEADGSFNWKRVPRDLYGKWSSKELLIATSYLPTAKTLFVHYSAGRTEDHEIGFEDSENGDNPIVSLELRIPTRQLTAYTWHGSVPQKPYVNAVLNLVAYVSR